MTAAIKFWISILLATLTAYGGYSFWRQYNRARVSAAAAKPDDDVGRPTGSLADARLVDSLGKPFSLDSLKGDVWLASFFFTSCPGPCAQMNRSIAGIQKEFPNKDLKFVSITCDPDNDSPKVLAEYAKTFQADPKRWLFLTGPLATVQHLGEDVFKIAVRHREHSQRVLLVDRDMKVRGQYLLDDQAQLIGLRRKLKSLLDNTAPSADKDTVESPPPAEKDAAHDGKPPQDAATDDKGPSDKPTAGKPTEEIPATLEPAPATGESNAIPSETQP